MANTKRAPRPKFTTGRGTARFPKLSEVDYGTDEYPNPAGSYSTSLIVSKDEPWVSELLNELQPMHDKAVAKGEGLFEKLTPANKKRLKSLTVNPLYNEETDKDTEEPTGNIIFRFKTKASGEYKSGKKSGSFWDARPSVFDRTGNTKLIAGFRRDRDDGDTVQNVHARIRPIIGGGSIIKVSFEVGLDQDDEPGYFVVGSGMAGLGLTLSAVQVIELAEGGDRSAASYGFGNEAEETADGSTDENATPHDVDF